MSEYVIIDYENEPLAQRPRLPSYCIAAPADDDPLYKIRVLAKLAASHKVAKYALQVDLTWKHVFDIQWPSDFIIMEFHDEKPKIDALEKFLRKWRYLRREIDREAHVNAAD